jgi:hypothetical protein
MEIQKNGRLEKVIKLIFQTSWVLVIIGLLTLPAGFLYYGIVYGILHPDVSIGMGGLEVFAFMGLFFGLAVIIALIGIALHLYNSTFSKKINSSVDTKSSKAILSIFIIYILSKLIFPVVFNILKISALKSVVSVLQSLAILYVFVGIVIFVHQYLKNNK